MNKLITAALLSLFAVSCSITKEPIKTEDKNVPESYNGSGDTSNTAQIKWREYFTDPYLVALIDTALGNNQELNIMLQEIEVANSEVKDKKGEYLPFIGLTAAAATEKSGRYTRNGSVEENLEIEPGKEFPEPLGDLLAGATFSWEVDVWKKMRNAKSAALARYLASTEGKNFMVTNLLSEIAGSYYELLALDNQLDIIQQNIAVQENALHIIKQQKDAAQVSQLAVNRFEAQLLNTQNLQYEVQQQIVETENRINFLVGRFPQPVQRNSASFNTMVFDSIAAGIPSQLLGNRPDIRRAEYQLAASKLDVKVAKANFYPTVSITAHMGYQAFSPSTWFLPESMIYNVAGDLVAPLVNRNAIKAQYLSSRAKQVQAVYNYEQTILEAYVEVVNQLSRIDKYGKSVQTKSNEVDILTNSITVADNLFKSARADYMEVLLTQREALESRMELIEIKQKQIKAEIDVYRALGGGWN